MKKVLSVLGAATAVVLLAPWKVTREEGETRLSALTWEASIGRSENGSLSVQVKPCLNDPRTLLGGEAAGYAAESVYTAPAAEAETVVLDPEEAADYADVDLPDAPDADEPESEEEQACISF